MTEQLEKRIVELAEYLLKLEQTAGFIKQRRSKESERKFHLSTAWLCKRLLTHHAASPSSGMRISRDKNRYKKSRYVPEGISYDITIEGVLALLHIDGFVRTVDNFRFNHSTGKGDQTRIAGTKKLTDWFVADPALLPQVLVGFDDTDPLAIQITKKRKGKNKEGKEVTFKTKQLLDYTDDAQTRQMRKSLKVINDCLKRHWSDLYLSDAGWAELQRSLVSNKKYDYAPIRLHRQTIRRIFNSTNFDTGGRFYGGWWQNIPSAYRGLITIDGYRTAEFDFGRMHPTMLYADEGLILEDDAYDIGIGKGDEFRDVVKQLFNAMVQMKEPQERPPRDVKFSQTGKTWKQLRELIIEKHEPIRHKFFRGEGNKLQYKDSIIAEEILLHFSRQDIAVLPVHDSFLIRKSLQPQLLNVMNKVFQKHYAVPINVKDGRKFLAMDFPATDEIVVEDLVQHMSEFDGWCRRNPI